MEREPITVQNWAIGSCQKYPHIIITVNDPAAAEGIADYLIAEAKEAMDCEAYSDVIKILTVALDLQDAACDLRQALMTNEEAEEDDRDDEFVFGCDDIPLKGGEANEPV